MKQDVVNILVAAKTKDGIGREVLNWPVNRTVNGSFQPLKYNALYKPYGITDKTCNVLYCKDSNITADNRIGFNSKQYRIVSILPYKKHVEIYLELVI